MHPLIPRTLLCLSLIASAAQAAVSADEAAKLKSSLTPFGAEKAGNADGSIPAWTGGYTTPVAGFKNGGRRGDPFASEKPLYSISADNLAQHFQGREHPPTCWGFERILGKQGR